MKSLFPVRYSRLLTPSQLNWPLKHHGPSSQLIPFNVQLSSITMGSSVRWDRLHLNAHAFHQAPRSVLLRPNFSNSALPIHALAQNRYQTTSSSYFPATPVKLNAIMRILFRLTGVLYGMATIAVVVFSGPAFVVASGAYIDGGDLALASQVIGSSIFVMSLMGMATVAPFWGQWRLGWILACQVAPVLAAGCAFLITSVNLF
ncbi:hypothetical protein BC830DRAFT_1157227 [Chytriomyces sp. MP71]|nr:hypothetical protein BC830DRAFT_1157227 [Chytriomyces sp. MP71]